MNIDEFIVPSSIGTPSGVSPLSSGRPDDTITSTATAASAIPIKQQQRLQGDEFQLSRASAPSVPLLDQGRSNEEFSYIQRHVRKTSVDERRVCIFLSRRSAFADIHSQTNDEPKRHRKCHRSITTASYSKVCPTKLPSMTTR